MQQINLLDPRLMTPQVAFSAATIALTLTALVGLGLAIYLWASLAGAGMRSQMMAAQAARDDLQARVDALNQPSEEGLNPQDQRARDIALAKQQVERLQQLLAALGGGPGAGGFSVRLRALAAQGEPGVWLTGIEFGQTGFRLEGRALEAARIPDYLAVLSRQPGLQGLPLAGFSVVQPDDSDGTGASALGVSFTVNPVTGSAQ